MIIEKLTTEDVTSLKKIIYKEIPLFFIYIFIKLSFIFILPVFIILYFFQITYKSVVSENFAYETIFLLITVLCSLLALFLIILIVKFIKVDYPLKITCNFTIIDKEIISNTTDNTFIDSSYYYQIILINTEYKLKKKIQVDSETYKKIKKNQIIKLKYYDVINKLIEASFNDEKILNVKILVSPLRAFIYTLKRICGVTKQKNP